MSDSPPVPEISVPPAQVMRRSVEQDVRWLDCLTVIYHLSAAAWLFAGAFIAVIMGLWAPRSGPLTTKLLGWSITFPTHQGGGGVPRSDLTMWTYGAMLMLGFIMIAAALRWTALALKKRSGRSYCQVIAVLVCCSGSLWGLLGVITLIVLARPNVVWMFGQSPEKQLRG